MIYREIKGLDLDFNFPRISYADAMHEYGSDKPDLRFELKIKHFTDLFAGTAFNAFASVIAEKGSVAGIVASFVKITKSKIIVLCGIIGLSYIAIFIIVFLMLEYPTMFGIPENYWEIDE